MLIFDSPYAGFFYPRNLNGNRFTNYKEYFQSGDYFFSFVMDLFVCTIWSKIKPKISSQQGDGGTFVLVWESISKMRERERERERCWNFFNMIVYSRYDKEQLLYKNLTNDEQHASDVLRIHECSKENRKGLWSPVYAFLNK